MAFNLGRGNRSRGEPTGPIAASYCRRSGKSCWTCVGACSRVWSSKICANDKQLPALDAESIRRFCRPDIANVVEALWPKHGGHPEARFLLLKLIWLGDLKQCAGLAADAASGQDPDPRCRITAGGALLKTCDDPTKLRYAEFIKAERPALPRTVVWDAIDGLFPSFLSIEDLLAILKEVDVADGEGGLGFLWGGPSLVNRLDSRSDLERLLAGLLGLLGGEIGDFIVAYPLDKREQAYFPAIAAAATRLLALCAGDEVPELAIDAALRLGIHRLDNSCGTENAGRQRRAASNVSAPSPCVLGSSQR